MVQLKKMQVKVVSVLIALVFIGSVVGIALSQNANLGVASAASDSNVGVVDYEQFGTLPMVTEVEQQLQKIQQDAVTEFEAKSVNMTDAEKQQYYQQTMQRLAEKHQELMSPIRAKIDAAVKAVADKQGLSVVILKDTVVYGGKDITQDVVKELSK